MHNHAVTTLPFSQYTCNCAITYLPCSQCTIRQFPTSHAPMHFITPFRQNVVWERDYFPKRTEERSASDLGIKNVIRPISRRPCGYHPDTVRPTARRAVLRAENTDLRDTILPQKSGLLSAPGTVQKCRHCLQATWRPSSTSGAVWNLL